jgi:pyruvate/2-oxoglutarate/acetoin dehydrogenase E1 component
MSAVDRVSENLNRGLHRAMATDPDLYLLGEDVADPYGGAFRVTRGLSTAFPDRVLSTPISESGIVGVANGLALTGNRAIVEIMFGDFVALAFDQILNFAAKSVSMYGRALPLSLVVRCPVGAGRGYGPTHSQSPQKHFVGIPGLTLAEMSPFHDNGAVLAALLAAGRPAIFFEDKVLYTQSMLSGDTVDLFTVDRLDLDGNWVRAFVDDPDDASYVLVAPGGLAGRALDAARILLLEHEVAGQVLVPSRLYPFDPDPLAAVVPGTGLLAVVEEGTPGGSWGAEVAVQMYARHWNALRRPVCLVSGQDSVVPSAPHLERDVVVSPAAIAAAILEAFDG